MNKSQCGISNVLEELKPFECDRETVSQGCTQTTSLRRGHLILAPRTPSLFHASSSLSHDSFVFLHRTWPCSHLGSMLRVSLIFSLQFWDWSQGLTGTQRWLYHWATIPPLSIYLFVCVGVSRASNWSQILYEARDDLELLTFLPLPWKHWNCRCIYPHVGLLYIY